MKDYVRINVASPKQILSWTERSFFKGELIGRLKNSVKTINKNLVTSYCL